jgi:predicted MFS family arabinose efflux permease
MEKKGIVKYGQYKTEKSKGGSIKVLFRYRIVKFSLIAAITGVVRTALISFLTEYFDDFLGFGDKASVVFTVVTAVISASAFISVFVYECLHRNMDLTILIMFSLSACFFLAVYFVGNPYVNVVFLVLAIMASNCSATMLWSRYCPSLRDTGMVSGATGFLDFLSYMAAALASTLIGRAITGIGWSNLILILMGLMLCGVAVALPYDKFKRKPVEQ